MFNAQDELTHTAVGAVIFLYMFHVYVLTMRAEFI